MFFAVFVPVRLDQQDSWTLDGCLLSFIEAVACRQRFVEFLCLKHRHNTLRLQSYVDATWLQIWTEYWISGWAIEKSMQQISSSSNPRGGFCAIYLWPLKMCQDSILKSSSVRWLQSKMSKSKNKQAFANIPRFAHIRAFSASVHANQGFPATIEVHEQLDQGDKKRVVWIAVISISESSNLWGHILYTQSPLKVFFAAWLYCLYFADEIIL